MDLPSHHSAAELLAATVLHLRGKDACDFAQQFAALAARPVYRSSCY